ncbi:hypothetical protein L1987_40349 [Smallanthus sonchifolius]|uniref:Uncharacterized protein n=1 Tax=Smallanthus sonchifolius TaxID=185202 RepID=A0ACB9GTN6_9ASTR|nr:hypothetical protein L1987_40349 [Smallanthus sonchifolius]
MSHLVCPTVNPTLYDSRKREFWETATYVYQENKHTITTIVDGKHIAIRIETIRTHLQLEDTKGKYSFPDSDVQQTFWDMGYGGNPKAEDIPPTPTSKANYLTEEREEVSQPISTNQDEGEGTSKDSKKLDEDSFNIKELTVRYQTLPADVSSIQISEKTQVESDQNLIRQHQASLETKISKAKSNPADPIFTSVAAESSSVATEDIPKEKAQGKMPIMEEEEAEKVVPITTGKFQMRDLTGIKMSTVSEMVKQVRKDQIISQQNISSNPNTPQPSHPTELLKVKKETAEEPKALSSHLTPTRIEVSTPSSQQTPSPKKEYSTPSPQRTVSTPSSSRKKRLVLKKTKASITSWNHMGQRYVIKRDDNTREMFKCISDVMELSKSNLERIVSLGIDRFNDSEGARQLIQARKKRGFSVREEEKKEEEPLETIPIVSWQLLGKTGQFLIIYQNGVQKYLSVDRIVTLVPNDLRALLMIPLKNDSNDQMGEFVKDAMHRQLDSSSSSKSSKEEEDEGKKERFFGKEDDPDRSDKDEFCTDTEVPLADSQVLISE